MTLLVSKSVFAITGSAQSSQDMIRCILAADVPLTIVSLQPPEKNFIEQNKKLKWITYYNQTGNIFANGSPIKNLYWQFKQISSIKKSVQQIRDAKPKHVIVNSLGSLYLFKKLPLPNNIQTTLFFRESPTIFNYKKNITIEEIKNLTNDFSNFIFLSENVKNEWEEAGIIKNQRTFYIPNAIKEDITEGFLCLDKNNLRRNLGLPTDRRIIISVASSVSNLKGHDLLLDAFKQIIVNHSDILLLLTGKCHDKELLNSIKKMSSHVLLINMPLPEAVLKYVAASDIFVFPSRTEAMPRAVLEAMALKKPIIASDVGAIPELIMHRQDGLVFKNGNRSEFKHLLEDLMISDEKQKIFSENAYKKYWNSFSRKAQLLRWKSFLTEIENFNNQLN